MTSPLFDPITVGALQLPNRIAMAPLTRSRSSEAGVVPAFAADYYAQRAAAGLIVSEATNISAQARGYAMTPGIWNEEQVAAWRDVTDAVHAADGRIVCQLWHTGRVNHPSLHDGELPVAPSAIRPSGQAFTNEGMVDHVTPRALEADEVEGIVQDYRHAAQQAQAAGFDGVEVHAANYYLLDQFLRPSSNQREDEYGGSAENRVRFPLAVAAVVAEVWGGDRVGVRLSPQSEREGMPVAPDALETYGTLLDGLAALELAYTHFIVGQTYETRDSPDVDFGALRGRAPGAILSNNVLDKKAAERVLAEGEADIAVFGRPFIANPDLVVRLRTGAPLAEAPKRYWYGGDETGYSDWPAMAA